VRWRRPSLPAICIGLLVLGALISGFTMLQDIDPFDEGLMLQAARRVGGGQLPYRDFLWAYGPAQPYLLAGLFKLFGVSLLHWRILRVLADAAVALVAYLLVRDRPVGDRPGAASAGRLRQWTATAVPVAVWLAAITEMAEPRSANPFAVALLCSLGALLVASREGTPAGRRTLLSAAVLSGLAAAFRLDFALYGLAGVAISILLGRGMRSALAYLVASVALIALVYLPFLVAIGPAALYHALIGTSLHTGAYWSLPFPLRFHPPPRAGAFKTAKHALDFYVPVLSIAAVALAAVAVLLRLPAERRLPARACGLIVLGAGTVPYLLSRSDEFHAQPVLVVAVVVLGLRAVNGPRRFIPACVLLLGLLLAHGVLNRLSALVHPPPESRLQIAVGDGVQARPPEARAIERMVDLVDAEVPPRAPIYVAARRSDLVRFNDPLIYVLTQRRNPTPEDFGLLTGAAAQARIVSELASVRPRVIVRWTDPVSSSREPNLRGRASGVHTLDRWISAHYRLLARLYHYDVLRWAG